MIEWTYDEHGVAPICIPFIITVKSLVLDPSFSLKLCRLLLPLEKAVVPNLGLGTRGKLRNLSSESQA